jgi:hypothetical protein
MNTLALSHDRVIQGILIKMNHQTGAWADRDDTPGPTGPLVALGTKTVVQLWQDQVPVETYTEPPYPDIAELNARIPDKEKPIGLDGKPKQPWVESYAAYLFDPKTATVYTSINSTVGQRIAVERLSERMALMRQFRGDNIVPITRLSSVIMKTRFGQKPRPDFPIDDWREWGAAPQAIEGPPQSSTAREKKLPGKSVSELSTAEIIQDSLP